MKTLVLKSNEEELRPVGRYLLDALFFRFREDLAWRQIDAPNPISQTPHFFHVATNWEIC